MRLIDADALLEELRKSCKWHAESSRELSLLQRDINIVEEQPTVDAIPVEWIEKYTEENRLYQSDDFDLYIRDMIADWTEEIRKWKKERMK